MAKKSIVNAWRAEQSNPHTALAVTSCGGNALVPMSQVEAEATLNLELEKVEGGELARLNEEYLRTGRRPTFQDLKLVSAALVITTGSSWRKQTE